MARLVNKLTESDMDHPIFRSQDVMEFREQWLKLNDLYTPRVDNQPFRILSTIQNMGLAIVQCKSFSTHGIIWDIDKDFILLKQKEVIGTFISDVRNVTLVEVLKPISKNTSFIKNNEHL